jgi:hypothetical protein
VNRPTEATPPRPSTCAGMLLLFPKTCQPGQRSDIPCAIWSLDAQEVLTSLIQDRELLRTGSGSCKAIKTFAPERRVDSITAPHNHPDDSGPLRSLRSVHGQTGAPIVGFAPKSNSEARQPHYKEGNYQQLDLWGIPDADAQMWNVARHLTSTSAWEKLHRVPALFRSSRPN